MPLQPAVVAQLSAIKARVGTSAGKVSTFALSDLGLGDPEFNSALIYPSPTLPIDAVATGSEWLELFRYLESHLTFLLMDRDVTEFWRYAKVLATAMLAAKQSLGGVLGQSLHVRMIRPATVYANGATLVETWLKAAVAQGWTAAYFTINLNASSAIPAINTINNVAMVVIAVADLDVSAKLLEYQWYDSGNKPQGVENVTDLQVQHSTGIHPLRQCIYIDKDKVFKLDVNFAAAGESVPVLFGAEFVTDTIFTAE